MVGMQCGLQSGTK